MTTKIVSFILAALILITSCVSTTVIQSSPSGAKLYLNGEPVGVTPYTHQDGKIVGSTTLVKLEKEGYESLNTSFTRDEEVDVGAVIGGIFFMFPFLWTMKYKPYRLYEMKPAEGAEEEKYKNQLSQVKSKADMLREIKQLYDDGIISWDEYEKERKKVLNEK